MIPEEKIIKRCLKGDRRAQKELYSRYKNAFFMLVQRYAAHREEAQDYLQDGFIKIFRDLDQYDQRKGSFYTWGRMVMVNTALQHIRKRRILIADSQVEDHQETFSTNADAFEDLKTQDLYRLISELPVGYRAVFNMYAIEGYSHKEIADLLDITESTSKSQLYKAKKALQKKLEGLAYEESVKYESK